MTFQITQRGKEYLKTAQTMLRAAQTMTDRAIAGQLKALADDCQRRRWDFRRAGHELFISSLPPAELQSGS
jgi:hypothetical protein